MDLATLIKERNEEYVNLVRGGGEDPLRAELKRTTDEAASLAERFAGKAGAVIKECESKKENVNAEGVELVRELLDEAKKIRSAYPEGGEGLWERFVAACGERLAEIESRHLSMSEKIEAVFRRQLKDNDDEYQSQLFILENSRRVSNEMESIESDMTNNDTKRRIEALLEDQKSAREEVEAELQTYRDSLKSYLRDSDDRPGPYEDKSKLMDLVRRYYAVSDEIDGLRDTYAVPGEESDFSGDDVEKAEIISRHESGKAEAEASRLELLDADERGYEVRKLFYVEIQSPDSDADTEDVNPRVDGALQKATELSDALTSRAVEELEKEAEDKLFRLREEEKREEDELAKKEASLMARLETAEGERAERLSAFTETARRDIDACLVKDADCIAGDGFPGAAAFPGTICIGGRAAKMEDCELTRALYGGETECLVPLTTDVRECGNIVINAPGLGGEDETLDAIMRGLAFRYAESFPLGALKIHFADANPGSPLDKIAAPFAGDAVTFDEDFWPRLKETGEKLRGAAGEEEIPDRLHGEDGPFHLFVIRSGLSDFVEYEDVGTLRALGELFGERGRKCGVRFIAVNDYAEGDSEETEKNTLLDGIIERAVNLSYDGARVSADGAYVRLPSAGEDDADKFAARMAEALADEDGRR